MEVLKLNLPIIVNFQPPVKKGTLCLEFAQDKQNSHESTRILGSDSRKNRKEEKTGKKN